MPNAKEKELLKMYAQKNLGSIVPPSNPCCVECNKEHKSKFETDLFKPVSAWVVGDNFDSQEKRILFVGKTAVGAGENKYFYPGYPDDGENHYCTEVFFDARKKLWPNYSRFWSTISNVSKRIFLNVPIDDLVEYIAITNLIKCNCGHESCASGHIEKFEFMRFNCIDYLDIIRREISIINPTHIVFLVGKNFDENICSIFDELNIIQRISQPRKDRWIGEGRLSDLGHKIHILRTCHPQYAPKDIEDSIVDFITNNQLI
ncbi:hypothetical protein [Selenomonas sp. KH1T6]|uniref:hypothetical protein n=1 Tax=Selenomonas sp. KH1T6 TaxID=3158784 RepID=UPI0008A78A6D|nr:hypothetical protein SAMN05216583_1572 [Selenomonas ruminantium]